MSNSATYFEEIKTEMVALFRKRLSEGKVRIESMKELASQVNQIISDTEAEIKTLEDELSIFEGHE